MSERESWGWVRECVREGREEGGTEEANEVSFRANCLLQSKIITVRQGKASRLRSSLHVG